MKFFIRFIVLIALLPTLAYSQTAALLPNAVQQFFDNNGNPLSGGTVTTYIAGTSTLKTTWKNSTETIANTNPIILDAGGKAIIYGQGTYRQVVKDRNGNVIWDAVTAPGGNGGEPSTVGDGNLVGTILPWSGLNAPNQYVFAYGQEITRFSSGTTLSSLFTALTLNQTLSCTNGSPILTGLSDTSQIPFHSVVESTCAVPGSVVISKTTSTVTLDHNSTITSSASATFFMYGNGNGTTTFNLPDLRGYTVAGRDNMGGTSANRLTSTYFFSLPNALGATGGLQAGALGVNNLPPYTPAGKVSVSTPTGTVAITDPGHAHTLTGQGSNNFTTFGTGSNITSAGGAQVNYNTPVSIASNTTGITAEFTGGASTGSFDGTAQGGSSLPFSMVQPTITLNYIIKITPDASSSVATGVASLGGMTGVIACGNYLSCTGNIISVSLLGVGPITFLPQGSIPGGGSIFADLGGDLVISSGSGSIQFNNTDNTVPIAVMSNNSQMGINTPLLSLQPNAQLTVTGISQRYGGLWVDTPANSPQLFSASSFADTPPFLATGPTANYFLANWAGPDASGPIYGKGYVLSVESLVANTSNSIAASAAIYGGLRNDRAKGNPDFTGIIGVINNTPYTTSPSGGGVWGIIRGRAVGTSAFVAGVKSSNEGFSGIITSLGSITAGSGYSPGSYTNVPLTGGSGTGATANIVVSGGGAVSSVTLTGPVDTLGSITGGSSYTNGEYQDVPLTGGQGSGATADLVVSGGVVISVSLHLGGTGYLSTDILSAANIGGGTGFAAPISVISPGAGYIVGNVLSASQANLGNIGGSGFQISVTAIQAQNAKAGFVVLNSTPDNAFETGVYVSSSTLYGVRVGDGQNSANEVEPVYPYVYLRKADGRRAFSINTDGDLVTTKVNIFNSLIDATAWNFLPISSHQMYINFGSENVGYFTSASSGGPDFGLFSTGGGSILFKAASTASTFTLTLPPRSGTLITSGDTGTVTNTILANSSTTVNGTVCTLGSTCTVATAATSVTIGTTTITGGTTTRVLYDNAGVFGEYTNTQLTALINVATTSLSGALPAWPNNSTTFFRGDGTYTTVTSGALNITTTSCTNQVVTAISAGAVGTCSTVTNAMLTNTGTTVNGTVCTLGSTCTVTAAAGTLTGGTLAAGVTASSLTSLGTITSLTATQINAFTLAGTVAGGGNQLNNVVIGTTTPLAGSFTAIVGTSYSATAPVILPQGRLTLTTATPVMTATASAQQTVYYSPYNGQFVPIYNGTNFVSTNIGGELSVNMAANANWVAVTNYDWFIGNDSGTIRLCSGPAWSNSISRGTGAGTTEIARLAGLYTNAVSMTCRYGAASTFTCGVNRCTLVGTIKTTTQGVTEYVFGTTAANGGEASFLLWNAYNRVLTRTMVGDSTASYVGAGGGWIAAHSSNTMRASYLMGLPEDAVDGSYNVSNNASTGSCQIGVALDATNTFTGTSGDNGSSNIISIRGELQTNSQGFHFIQAVELNINSAVCTYYSSDPQRQNALILTLRN